MLRASNSLHKWVGWIDGSKLLGVNVLADLPSLDRFLQRHYFPWKLTSLMTYCSTVTIVIDTTISDQNCFC